MQGIRCIFLFKVQAERSDVPPVPILGDAFYREFKVQGSRSKVHGTWFKGQGSRGKVQGASGSAVPTYLGDAFYREYKAQDSRYKAQGTRHKAQGTTREWSRAVGRRSGATSRCFLSGEWRIGYVKLCQIDDGKCKIWQLSNRVHFPFDIINFTYPTRSS